MTRRHVTLDGGNMLAYGHWGRPVLAFPSEQGPCWQYEERGMVAAIEHLLDAGRLKLYCVDSFDTCRSRSAHAGTATSSGGSSSASCRGSGPTPAAQPRSPSPA